MIQRLCMLIALVLAVAGAFFAPHAVAQGEPTCAIEFVEGPETEPVPVSTAVPATGDTDTTTDSALVGSDDATAAHSCADAETYPGPFTNAPATPSGPYAVPTVLYAASPAAPAVAVVEQTKPALAHSGSETFILAYLGTGLLAFGAVALGIRRGSGIE